MSIKGDEPLLSKSKCTSQMQKVVKQKDLEISRHSKGNKTGHSHLFKQCQYYKGLKVI